MFRLYPHHLSPHQGSPSVHGCEHNHVLIVSGIVVVSDVYIGNVVVIVIVVVVIVVVVIVNVVYNVGGK